MIQARKQSAWFASALLLFSWGVAHAQNAPSSPAAPSPALPGSRLLNQVELFQQIQALNLTPAQTQEIATRLVWLSQAQDVHATHIDTKVAPVLPALRHEKSTLLATGAVPAADEQSVHTALLPLQAESKQMGPYEDRSIAAIRAALNRRQIRMIWQFLGYWNNNNQGGGGAGFGQNPVIATGVGGAGAPGAPGTTTFGNPGTNSAAGAGGQGQPGGNPNGGRRRRGGMGNMMNNLRSMPQAQYDQEKGRITSRMLRRSGLQPGSADYIAAQNNLESQFDQMRQMPDSQYQSGRRDLMRNMFGQLRALRNQNQQNGGGNGATGGNGTGGPGGVAGGAGGALGTAAATESPRQMSDDDAVRQFFTQDGALNYFSRRLAPAALGQRPAA